MTALAILGVTAPVDLAVWLSAECVIWLILRTASEGTFRFQVAGMESVIGSLTIHCKLMIAVGNREPHHSL